MQSQLKNSKPKDQGKKSKPVEEELAAKDLEEGKSSNVSDFISKSPVLSKKRMDFGNGSSNEAAWLLTSDLIKKSSTPKTIESLSNVGVEKVGKWGSSLCLVDSNR